MTTALDMITDASLMVGTLGHGEALPPEESAYALRQLNAMLSQWNLDKLSLYYFGTASWQLGAGTALYQRPMLYNSVGERGYARYGVIASITGTEIDYPILPMSADDYAAIGNKGLQSLPTRFWMERAYPYLNFTFWPVPAASMVFYVPAQGRLQSFAALTDTVSLPDGYVDAITSNLALRLCIGRQAPSWVVDQARESKAAVQRMSVQRTEMQIGAPIGRRMFDINRGY